MEQKVERNFCTPQLAEAIRDDLQKEGVGIEVQYCTPWMRIQENPDETCSNVLFTFERERQKTVENAFKHYGINYHEDSLIDLNTDEAYERAAKECIYDAFKHFRNRGKMTIALNNDF